MKNGIENKISRFRDLLEPIAKNSSSGKRQYINNILTEILSEVNCQELMNDNLRAKLTGFPDAAEYNTTLDKCLSILWFFGMTSTEFTVMRKDILDWMGENSDLLKRPATWPEVVKIYRFIEHFETFEERMPKDLTELKSYIDDYKG